MAMSTAVGRAPSHVSDDRPLDMEMFRSRTSSEKSIPAEDAAAHGDDIPVPYVSSELRKRVARKSHKAPPLTALMPVSARKPTTTLDERHPLIVPPSAGAVSRGSSDGILPHEDRSACPSDTSTSSRSAMSRINLANKALIGKGSYGLVYQAMDRDTNRIIAVKEIPVGDAGGRHSGDADARVGAVRRELTVMRHLDHPNIVRFLGDEYDGSLLRIYMEYVPGGSISSLLKTFGPFQERQASNFTRQVLQGLVYLHCKGILHGDLKGDNFLVDTMGNLKVADFGAAKVLEQAQPDAPAPSLNVTGTAFFVAPEVVDGSAVDEKADIWSLGCCVIEMLTGRPPLSNMPNQYGVMMFIAQSKGELVDAYIPQDATWTPMAVDFVTACLQRRSDARPSAQELLWHPWIQSPTLEDNIPSPAKVTATSVLLDGGRSLSGRLSPVKPAARGAGAGRLGREEHGVSPHGGDGGSSSLRSAPSPRLGVKREEDARRSNTEDFLLKPKRKSTRLGSVGNGDSKNKRASKVREDKKSVAGSTSGGTGLLPSLTPPRKSVSKPRTLDPI